MQKSRTKSLTVEVDARLQVLGFHDPSKPDFAKADLDVPSCGLPEAPSEVLGTLYANYGALINYVSGVVGTFDVERVQAEHAYHEVRAVAMAAVRSNPEMRGASVSEKKAFAEDQPEVLAARREMATAEATSKKSQRLLEGYKTLWMSLSREMSRRAGSYSPQSNGHTPQGSQPGALRRQEGVRRSARRSG